MSTDTVRADLAAAVSIATATATARAGDLAGAARVLTALEPGPEVLDLLARVRAQAGDLAAADDCWARLQQAEPEHPGATAGRRTIAAIRAHRRPAHPVARPGRLAALAVLVLAGAVTAGVLLPAGPAAAPAPDGYAVAAARAAARARQAGDRADALARQLSDNAAAAASATANQTAALDALTARLTTPAIPGVRVSRSADAVAVLFDAGLFGSGDRLTAAGAGRLRTVGERLTGVSAAITVTGETALVPGGPATGGSPVALARATVTAERLAAAAHLPLTAITLASGDQASPPFGTAAQNRTATITLKPQPQP